MQLLHHIGLLHDWLSGRPDVLATAYVKQDKTLIALASWAPEKTEVRLRVDWQALGLDAAKARLHDQAIGGPWYQRLSRAGQQWLHPHGVTAIQERI